MSKSRWTVVLWLRQAAHQRVGQTELVKQLLYLFADTETEEVKSNGLDTTTVREDDLMICSQTVYG